VLRNLIALNFVKKKKKEKEKRKTDIRRAKPLNLKRQRDAKKERKVSER